MKLYLVHCGFYDRDLCGGIYESHVNLLIAADGFENAKISARENPEFRKRKMHVDGLQEIVRVGGYAVNLVAVSESGDETVLIGDRHRDL